VLGILVVRSPTEEASRLLEEAQEHKRQSQRHRRLAQQRMMELAKWCRENGIKYEEVHRHGEVREGHGQPPGRSGI